ncbi:alpha/beta hydrolase [Novosphingobium sp.]|uniref:alpha/beta fold hydrolase n=1 Tax=Novosphingobium sp. TaxID=1874826 RepID=UPI00286E84CE|nr:alpha/beta hydrolase [Novosphingobium sp.]
MKRFLRRAGLVLLVVLLGCGLFVLAARSGWLRPDDKDLRARYGLSGSQYVTIGGQELHLVEEGSGPAVILVHGSYGSLRMWNEWADRLKRRYRVIRFDRPGMGLSGPNGDARYDGDAEAELIGKLADHLKLTRFTLVGTSSSGEGAAHFAALHPERIDAVILANIAAGPLVMHPQQRSAMFKVAAMVDPWLKGWHSQALWRGVLETNYVDKAKVTPELVREWTELNNRTQGWPRKPWPSGKPFSGTPDDLAAIKAPTLLLWSDRDPETPVEVDGRRALALLASTDKALVTIPDCGHMMPQECGPQSAVAAATFLDRLHFGETKP